MTWVVQLQMWWAFGLFSPERLLWKWCQFLTAVVLEWPRTFLTFMSRYQFDLDQMRNECRERFGSTQSEACSICGKHIQKNLGRHAALYHIELAQLWRCPVTWCTVWKGTAQDCVDHMRRAHDISLIVKLANLARWFLPWTVTREQWSSMTRLAVSGIAVDTLLFSRIGMPLFHRYRGFNRPGTHMAFRGTYMQRLRTFLEELDAASLRRCHRRCAREIAAWMLRTSLRHKWAGAGSLFSTQGISSIGLTGLEV